MDVFYLLGFSNKSQVNNNMYNMSSHQHTSITQYLSCHILYTFGRKIVFRIGMDFKYGMEKSVSDRCDFVFNERNIKVTMDGRCGFET